MLFSWFLFLQQTTGSPSDWVLHKVNEIQHIVGLSYGGCEDQFKALLTVIEMCHLLETKPSFKKSRELKRLSWQLTTTLREVAQVEGRRKGGHYKGVLIEGVSGGVLVL